jgi:type I restriction enzyme R subunit
MDALQEIQRAIDSTVTLRNKRDLIMAFVDTVSITGDTAEDWRAFVQARRTHELETIIAEENLKPEATRSLMADAFRDGAVPTTGTGIVGILPPTSRFSGGGDHGERKRRVIARLVGYFERYHDVTSAAG